MRFFPLLSAWLLPFALAVGQPKPATPAASDAHGPRYTSDGKMLPPVHYRQWIYLTSGLDMSYLPRAGATAGMSMFDNAFVNPVAWQAFEQTGTWPDKTMIMLEARESESKASINKAGHFQGGLMGIEMHVKDAARGGWAFYEFNSDAPAAMVPKTESCYSCHQQHAAVDTTFVQFYPTLLPVAQQKGTLSSNYLKDETKAKPAEK